MQHLEVVRVL
jgi:hypothetical protein